MINYLIFY